MKLRRTLIGLVFAAATVGVIGPSAPAQAQCDPGPTATDGGSSSSCANTCQKLGAAVEKLTKRQLWECTL